MKKKNMISLPLAQWYYAKTKWQRCPDKEELSTNT